MKHLRFALLGIFLVASCPPVETADKPDPEILDKLREIVEIRELQWETAQLRAKLGHEHYSDLIASATALSESHIAVAKEEGQTKGVVVELKKIVKVLREKNKREKLLAEEDRVTLEEIGDLSIGLLEAEIRLLRVEKKIAGK